ACVFKKLSSRTEQITSEVRRLVLTARSLQAQLDQSIPKKTHEEVIARMQATIDGMAAELRRTKGQLEETQTIGQGLSILGKQVAAQGDTLKEAAMKISEVTVPNQVYQNALTRISDLEQVLTRKDQEIQNIRDSSVLKEQYIRSETRISELENILANSMPKTEFESLSQQIDTLTKAAPVITPGMDDLAHPQVAQTVQVAAN
ncbi:MAG: hypothetical protein OK457_03015, partial [Thaumarchaeota archaeon]|nr:hypothetical protein [Nitrososphaerota archaeon]